MMTQTADLSEAVLHTCNNSPPSTAKLLLLPPTLLHLTMPLPFPLIILIIPHDTPLLPKGWTQGETPAAWEGTIGDKIRGQVDFHHSVATATSQVIQQITAERRSAISVVGKDIQLTSAENARQR